MKDLHYGNFVRKFVKSPTLVLMCLLQIQRIEGLSFQPMVDSCLIGWACPKTNSSHPKMDGWEITFVFFFFFWGKLAVSFRV